jgi:spermidine synthase
MGKRTDVALHPSIIAGIFMISGAAGLIYEVVWARQLVLVFGNTTQAVSAILTGYFGGMAIGSVLGGRVADRIRSPLQLYGIVELILVLVVVLTSATFPMIHEVYQGLYGRLVQVPVMLSLVRFALCLLALGPATILLGTTLPILSRYSTREPSNFSLQFGRLYAANTLGAVLGTVLAGLFLIELLGLTGTLLTGAACSAIAGTLALLLQHRPGHLVHRVASVPAATPAESPPPGADGATAPDTLIPSSQNNGASTPLALATAFISGLTALGYEVLWTRLVSSGSGNTTYVFAGILIFYLMGIGLGAYLFARRFASARAPIALLGVLQLLIGIIAIGGLPVLSGALVELPPLLRAPLAVLPATILMGIAFPLTARLLHARGGAVGSSAGILLGANTLGTVVGTFVVPFALIPLMGSPRSVAALSVLNIGLGLWVLVRASVATPLPRFVARSAAAVLLLGAVAGSVVPNDVVADPSATRLRRHGLLFESAEDEIASVQAGSEGGGDSLWVAGSSMTSLTVSTKTLALLPLMLRPNAESLLMIAFGMGSTYRTALKAGLQVDGIELVPSVLKMFHHYFPDAEQVLADPRGRLAIADGRNYVELTNRYYDLIVVDPPPPVESSGTSLLFSREFYTACAARLAPNGVVTQWVPSYISIDDLRAHVRTFAEIFPNIVLAFDPAGNNGVPAGAIGVYMFGAFTPLELTQQGISVVLARPGLVEDLRESSDAPVVTREDWEALIPGLVWLTGPEVRDFAGTGPVITDDRPLTEYFLLRRMFQHSSPPAFRENLLPAGLR